MRRGFRHLVFQFQSAASDPLNLRRADAGRSIVRSGGKGHAAPRADSAAAV